MARCIRFNKKTQQYTLAEKDEDGSENMIPVPAKYSPEDRYGAYRRQAKEKERREQGLI